MPYRESPHTSRPVLYRPGVRGDAFGVLAMLFCSGLILPAVFALVCLVPGGSGSIFPHTLWDALPYLVPSLAFSALTGSLAWIETRARARVSMEAEEIVVAVLHWRWSKEVRRFRLAQIADVTVEPSSFRGHDGAQLGLRLIDGSFVPLLAEDYGCTTEAIARDGQERMRALLAHTRTR